MHSLPGIIASAAHLRWHAERPACEDWCSSWTCNLPKCSFCGLEHGCSREANPAASKKCASWCKAATCEAAECIDCGLEASCHRPPPPPSPPPTPPRPPSSPPHPPPPCLPPAIPVPMPPPSPPCTLPEPPGLNCLHTRCCENPYQRCYRKLNGYAACKEHCPGWAAGWDCEVLLADPPDPPAPPVPKPPPPLFPGAMSPPPPPPAPPPCTTGNFQRCWESLCCQDPGFSCQRRINRRFAMCRPTAPDCKNSPEWECPGWWSPPPPPPPAPPYAQMCTCSEYSISSPDYSGVNSGFFNSEYQLVTPDPGSPFNGGKPVLAQLWSR